MATWPSSGDTDWNTKMLAYLAIEHNTDGTHDIHDTEGGYAQVDVDGTKTNVYTKYLTGTLDADSETSVAHGVTGIDNILSVSVMLYDDVAAMYRVEEMFAVAAANNSFFARFDATNIVIGTVGANFQGNNYRIKIDYIL